MRKIIESTLMSLDGVVEDPASWAGQHCDSDFEKGALERLLRSDAMLMGRRTYEMLCAVSAGFNLSRPLCSDSASASAAAVLLW